MEAYRMPASTDWLKLPQLFVIVWWNTTDTISKSISKVALTMVRQTMSISIRHMSVSLTVSVSVSVAVCVRRFQSQSPLILTLSTVNNKRNRLRHAFQSTDGHRTQQDITLNIKQANKTHTRTHTTSMPERVA